MSELKWLIDLIDSHPGSMIVLIVGTIMFVIYAVGIGNRILAVEHKLGIVKNGKELEQVVTRADLNEALFGLTKDIKEFMESYVKLGECELKHRINTEDITEIKQILRERHAQK